MWLVRPATMTRRTERLSRLLRLWLTTMPSDFATFPRLSRLSPERLYDFPARVCDFDRAADLSTGSAALSLSPADRRRVPPGRRGRCWGSGSIWAAFLPFIMYSAKSVVFQTVASVNKKLDKISIKHLTINKTLDILKLSIKRLIIKFEFERGLYYEKDF